jgi:hypothetical protein
MSFNVPLSNTPGIGSAPIASGDLTQEPLVLGIRGRTFDHGKAAQCVPLHLLQESRRFVVVRQCCPAQARPSLLARVGG